jgi:Beta-ketoacyl synthase, N-terminal domain
MTGIFGIARGDRSPASAISAGAETLGYALLEAHAQLASDPSSPVLLVYADEPADAAYGTIEDEVQGGALAILLDAQAATGHLACTISGSGTRADETRPLRGSFLTQSEAVQRCLETQACAAWQNAGSTWQWSWHEGAA